MTNGEVEVGAEMTNDGWNEKVESLLINNFSCDANERKKKWKRSERVCDREEEGECIATMLQCGVDLLAAGFEGKAAGFFDRDCREMLVFWQSA